MDGVGETMHSLWGPVNAAPASGRASSPTGLLCTLQAAADVATNPRLMSQVQGQNQGMAIKLAEGLLLNLPQGTAITLIAPERFRFRVCEENSRVWVA